MNKSLVVLLVLGLLLFSACRSKKKIAGQSLPETAVKELIIDREYQFSEDDIPAILAAGIDGDILTLTLNYHGGKAMHNFDLYFNGVIMKSMPPQVNLFLKHTHTPENCEKLLNETVKFDLKKLRIGETGKIIVRIHGYSKVLEFNY